MRNRKFTKSGHTALDLAVNNQIIIASNNKAHRLQNTENSRDMFDKRLQ